MRVLKFGGTSVGTPKRMQNLVNLITSQEKPFVVLSAVAKTTDKLVKISDLLINQDSQTAVQKIKELEEYYYQFVEELFHDLKSKSKGHELVESHFSHVKSFTNDLFTVHEQRTILAQGELISSALLHYCFEERKIPSILLSALDFMRLNDDNEPDMEYIKNNLLPKIKKSNKNNVFITQGYICRNVYGEIDNLKRGGSDYSASLIGAALNCEEVQIWTDIDGMHNNDPRHVKNTKSIRELSFEEASELAYFGAKILHPASILPAMQSNIPVHLLNTLDPSAPGTLITNNRSKGKIKAVAAKDGITAIKIKSSRMLLAYGFLRKIFEIFERYKTSIDMITTSEVAVSLTIDDDTHLESIKQELKHLGNVEIDQGETIICIVGDFIAENAKVVMEVLHSLKELPVRMISFGGSKNNISILVNSQYKSDALNALHRELFHV